MSRALLSILSASLFLAACSSGTDEFTNAGPAAPETTFNITSTNGLAATKVAWESVVASADFSDGGGSLPIASAGSGDLSKSALTQTAALAANTMQQIPFGPVIVECNEVDPTSTYTISGDIADPLLSTLTAGDTFSVLYSMCDEGTGEIIDGQVDFTVGDFTGDFGAGTYLLSMDTVVTNLQVITAADTLTSNGDATISLDTSDAPFVDVGTSGTSMTTDSNASSETISNYQSNQTVDGNLENLPYTMTASGTLDTTQLAGIISYSTPIEFSGEGVDYPSVGVLLVQGANSSARLTAIDNIDVMIELDVNGDGETDQTINTTWVDLTT